MTKLEKLAKELNDEFRTDLKAGMFSRFGIEIETNFSFLTGNIISTRIDGADFTAEQMEFMQTYEKGYVAAMVRVSRAAGLDGTDL